MEIEMILHEICILIQTLKLMEIKWLSLRSRTLLHIQVEPSQHFHSQAIPSPISIADLRVVCMTSHLDKLNRYRDLQVQAKFDAIVHRNVSLLIQWTGSSVAHWPLGSHDNSHANCP